MKSPFLPSCTDSIENTKDTDCVIWIGFCLMFGFMVTWLLCLYACMLVCGVFVLYFCLCLLHFDCYFTIKWTKYFKSFNTKHYSNHVVGILLSFASDDAEFCFLSININHQVLFKLIHHTHYIGNNFRNKEVLPQKAAKSVRAS